MDRKVTPASCGLALMFLGFLSEAVGRVLGHPYRRNYKGMKIKKSAACP